MSSSLQTNTHCEHCLTFDLEYWQDDVYFVIKCYVDVMSNVLPLLLLCLHLFTIGLKLLTTESMYVTCFRNFMLDLIHVGLQTVSVHQYKSKISFTQFYFNILLLKSSQIEIFLIGANFQIFSNGYF